MLIARRKFIQMLGAGSAALVGAKVFAKEESIATVLPVTEGALGRATYRLVPESVKGGEVTMDPDGLCGITVTEARGSFQYEILCDGVVVDQAEAQSAWPKEAVNIMSLDEK